MIYKKLSHIVIAISLFLLGCNKVDISDESQIELLNKVFGVKASTSSIKNGRFFF